MKKLLLPFLFILLMLPSMAQQNYVYISGIVTDSGTGSPIPGQAVTISNDSASGWFYYQTTYTNNSGFYSDTVPVPLNTQGILYVRTIDCQNFLHQTVITFMPSVLNFTVNFNICYNNNPCLASFNSQQQQPLTVQFLDASVGGNNLRSWQFGDGSSSTLVNPVHQYAIPGYYNVSLTIGALGSTCYNITSQTIYVWDSTAGGCQANFYFVPDSINTQYTYHFFDQSAGNIVAWDWNFGDGSASSDQNPVHTYASPGTYTTCLTIHGSDSCYDVSCATIVVQGGGGGCQAAYTYYADTANPSSLTTYQFIDQSIGNIIAWSWNFGDPGSGTSNSSSLQNPTHVFTSNGTYNVCLTVHGADSSCYDVLCSMVVVGSPNLCHAAFTYYSDSVNVSNTVHFIDLSTGNISNWLWNFGDGTSSSEQNPIHSFPAPGWYPVTLSVSSPNQGCFDTITDTVYVGNTTGCQADFTATCMAPGFHTVNFTDLSTGNPTAWFWSFGDGTSGNVQNPVHTYASPGTYTVCLTISGNNCTSTFCLPVVIMDSVNYHQVYGQVFAGNMPISMGLAMIFSFADSGNYAPYVGVSLIDSNGVYYFTSVPDGNYYILALPFDSLDYLPTYYGNTISWQQATLITLGTANNPYNINLQQSDQMNPGPGSASGQINMGDVSVSMTDKINMIIMNEQGSPIGFTKVSTNGTFVFPSLAYGTYYLRPELPGVTSDQVKITLTAESPNATIVMTYTGNSILGVHDKMTIVNDWMVYPNPFTENITVTIDVKQAADAQITVYNVSGQQVAGRDVTLTGGSNTVRIPAASLPAGIYSLRLYSNGGINVNAKLVKAR